MKYTNLTSAPLVSIILALTLHTQHQVQPLDGINLLPVFDQQTDQRTKPIPFWNHNGPQPGHAALLDWPFKLHTDSKVPKNEAGKREGNARKVALYDVSKDPKETLDLAEREPERVAKMTASLAAWKESVEASLSGADYSK